MKMVFLARGSRKLVDWLRIDEEVMVASSYYIDDGLDSPSFLFCLSQTLFLFFN